ncbi:MAG: aminotransferase class V-fold PLP-dependent enzyme [Cytophagales bacterium]
MSNIQYLTPGPTGLYPTVKNHILNALDQDVCSISHRSKKFEAIFQETTENLRNLLGLPDDYHIFFTGSATEIWDRIIENCAEATSFHLVNGSFSKRFYETARELKRNAFRFETDFGTSPDVSEINIPIGSEVICFTHNETSSGVSMPIEDINKLRARYEHMIAAVDAVSSMPYPKFDYSKVDTVMFSVQKGFGLPAGLGVWLVNERCIAKAKDMQSKHLSIGSYHNLLSLAQKGKSLQTPETPNVLGIYLLGKVAGDMLKIGIDKIRKDTESKASILYDFFDKHGQFSSFVKNKNHRSQTVVVVNSHMTAAELNKFLAEDEIQIGSGYGKFKESQIRIANFPGTSIETIEKLVEKLKKY